MSSKNKLKIGLVLDSSLDNPDGVQQYIIDLGEWLREQGHDVHYLVGQTSRNDLGNIHSLSRNINAKFNGNKTTIPLPTNRKKLKKLLSYESFDVLHIQIPHSPFLAHRLILAADKKTVIFGTFHVAAYSRFATLGTRLLGFLLNKSIKRFDKIVSTSTASANFAKKTFIIDTEILPCVFNYERFHNAKPLQQYEDHIVNILFLGRLVKRKGCELLIEAIALLRYNKQLPPFRVIICGTGPLESHLRNLISKYGLDNIVSIEGYIEENIKPNYYASADISVFPSSGGESFGIVLLEAMASGRAVVLAGNNPGYETVMSPKPELLFNTDQATSLAGKLKYYLENSEKRKVLQKWGSIYTKDFDVDVVGSKLELMYNSEISKK
jgi:phosphatidylinositol alpha-mannosyltransferase